MQAAERNSHGINNMNRSLVRSSPQSYGQLHNETYLLYMKPNTFITRNRSRVRRSPQSYGLLLKRPILYVQKLKPSYIDAIGELEALLEAMDIYAFLRMPPLLIPAPPLSVSSPSPSPSGLAPPRT